MSKTAKLESENQRLRVIISMLEKAVNNLQDNAQEMIMLLTEDQLIELAGGPEEYKRQVDETRGTIQKAIDRHKNIKHIDQRR